MSDFLPFPPQPINKITATSQLLKTAKVKVFYEDRGFGFLVGGAFFHVAKFRVPTMGTNKYNHLTHITLPDELYFANPEWVKTSAKRSVVDGKLVTEPAKERVRLPKVPASGDSITYLEGSASGKVQASLWAFTDDVTKSIASYEQRLREWRDRCSEILKLPIYQLAVRYERRGKPFSDNATKRYMVNTEVIDSVIFVGNDINRLRDLREGYRTLRPREGSRYKITISKAIRGPDAPVVNPSSQDWEMWKWETVETFERNPIGDLIANRKVMP